MRLRAVVSSLVWLTLVFAPSVESSSSSNMADASIQESKIAQELLTAVRADAAVEADIMVQLESPEQMLQRVCNDSDSLDRAEKSSCVVNNLQQFAEDSQQQIKSFLATRTDDYADTTFFWINNSVSVKKAKGELILALSGLETVVEITQEQIFHTMTSGGGNANAHANKPKTFGLGVMH
ncbi:hypothetical protein Poli38472_008069 [Pythium oligandrum]|uniref:Uncharacterized protein n=1 Tax=Pythium oligandrum TaxID=41045 RepID=A0A8K1CN54_PYTOL|nr:hypothetical protein Poli38472_008069 [Pythium oligandrum]|eukprot:TMW65427.1 hypothetical protein Poli38472_008069 [Pythium oligandrum]